MIKDSDRKILWTRAGNKCSMCDDELTFEMETGKDIVIGEEAHIVSEKVNGPRHREMENYDVYDNLVLLCPKHHTIVDKTYLEYSEERLKMIKDEHERKIKDRTSSTDPLINWIVYTNKNLKLNPITTGSELIDIVYGAEIGEFNNDEPRNREEMELISLFMRNLDDCDLIPELPISTRPELQLDITESINSLNEKGFVVVGVREKTKIKIKDSEFPWTIAHVSVLRASGSKIVKIHKSQ